MYAIFEKSPWRMAESLRNFRKIINKKKSEYLLSYSKILLELVEVSKEVFLEEFQEEFLDQLPLTMHLANFLNIFMK